MTEHHHIKDNKALKSPDKSYLLSTHVPIWNRSYHQIAHNSVALEPLECQLETIKLVASQVQKLHTLNPEKLQHVIQI